MDWSNDSQILRSNSGDYEILYWNPSTCRQITSPSTLRDVLWISQFCTLSFQTIGVWPENADGTDVNTVARNSDGKLLASGDDWGKVKLYSYPVSQPKVNLIIFFFLYNFFLILIFNSPCHIPIMVTAVMLHPLLFYTMTQDSSQLEEWIQVFYNGLYSKTTNKN